MDVSTAEERLFTNTSEDAKERLFTNTSEEAKERLFTNTSEEAKKKLFTNTSEEVKKETMQICKADGNEEKSKAHLSEQNAEKPKEYLFDHVDRENKREGMSTSLAEKAVTEQQEKIQVEEKHQGTFGRLLEHIESEAVRKAVQRDMESPQLTLNHNVQQKAQAEEKLAGMIAQGQQTCKENSSIRIPATETAAVKDGDSHAKNTNGRAKMSDNVEGINFGFIDGKLCCFGTKGMVCSMGNFYLQILEEKEKIWETVNEAMEVTGIISKRFWHLKIMTVNAAYEGEVQSERLYDFGWIREISGERAILYDGKETKKLLKIYIQKLIQSEKHQKVIEYDSAGWKWLSNDEICYLTSQGAIGRCSIPVRAARGFDMLTVPKSSQEILKDFLGMRNIIPGNVKSAIFLQHYLLAAQMTALFKKAGHQIEFCTALIGKTNTKKTSCGEIFTRVFNRTHSAVPEINFSATEAAIYEIMDKYADTIVMVDDLTPFENDADANEKRRKLENIIRAYGDRVPRRRCVSFSGNSKAKEFTPITGCALLTGETFSGGKSSRSRVVILNFEEGDVDNSVLSYYQKNLYILPNFIEKFLNYVAGSVENVMQILSYECEEARRSVGKSLKLPRYADAYGVLCAASRIFFDYIVEEGLMNVDDAQKLLASDRNLIFQIIAENDSAVSHIAPGIMFVEALKEAVNKGFVNLKDISELNGESAENCLICNGGFLCITSEKLWESAKKYSDYRRIYFPYKTGRELIESLKAENLILTKQEGGKSRSSHKIVLNGKVINRRFLYLHKEKVEEIWENLESY